MTSHDDDGGREVRLATTQAPGAALASTRDGFLVSGFPGVINVSKKVWADRANFVNLSIYENVDFGSGAKVRKS